MSFDWTCPYCHRLQAATNSQSSEQNHYIRNPNSIHGQICFTVKTVRCANEACKGLQLQFDLHEALDSLAAYRDYVPGDLIRSWQLLPESSAKPQPSYIPKPIVEDYIQACRIRDLSPKASATLSRRCLQGIVRDFCGVKKNTLNQEISSLRKSIQDGVSVPHVDAEIVEAMDDVRKIGNIGAHMEKDVNLIIDVEPSEAQQLIELIELLFSEWYVQRANRARRIQELRATAEKKEGAKKGHTD